MKIGIFKRNRNLITYILLGVCTLILYLFESVHAFPAFWGVFPAVTLVFVSLCGSVCGEYIGCVIGLIGGILCDVGASSSFCFNLIVITLIGTVCGLLSSQLFTKRFISSLLLTLSSLVFYFLIHWLIYKVIAGCEGFSYLWHFSLPLVIHSFIYSIPLYFVVKFISKRKV